MEANLSSKSQRKTIHDSHFFINTHSTRQPPVTATIPTPASSGLFCRGFSGPLYSHCGCAGEGGWYLAVLKSGRWMGWG